MVRWYVYPFFNTSNIIILRSIPNALEIQVHIFLSAMPLVLEECITEPKQQVPKKMSLDSAHGGLL